MTYLIALLPALLLAYLAFGVLYQLFFAVAGLLPKPKVVRRDDRIRKMMVMIAAYKEDQVIVDTAKHALKQRYPSDSFEVMVLADHLRADTLWELRRLPIRLVEMNLESSTKSKSLRAGLAEMAAEDFDAVVVLDADNRMAPNFLEVANTYLSAGFQAIQGQRTANPSVRQTTARWDAISEAINNHVLCAGHHAIGLSARLAGSGMIFERRLFHDVMQDVHALGGFDKELELKLTQQKVSIAYASEASVYDEKVGDPEVFARQRGRWLAAQYRYAKRFLLKGVVALLLRGQVDFANKSIQMALPPRLLLPVGLLLGCTLSLPISLNWAAAFGGLFLLNMATFALALPPALWREGSWTMLSHLPQMIWGAVRAVLSIPASAKTFYHTPHREPVHETAK